MWKDICFDIYNSEFVVYVKINVAEEKTQKNKNYIFHNKTLKD